MSDLFPLPLTAFDQMMLLDGPSPAEGWVEACFLGHLSFPALQEAVRVVSERHLLLVSRIESFRGRPCWVPGENPIPLVRLGPGEPWREQPLRPREGVGARLYLVEKPTGSSLFLQVHHANCDGAAARLILYDLFGAYARACEPHGGWPELTRLEPSRLKSRGQIPEPPRSQSPPPTLRGLLEVVRFLFPWPEVLVGQKGSPGELPFSKRVFNREETDRVLDRARRGEGRLNEQAISDLFATLAEWQLARGRPGNSRLRVLIPMDLRTLEDRRMPAGNRVTFAFLARRLGECGGDLRASLLVERDYIREHRTDLDFLRSLELVRKWRILPGILRLPVSLSSSVLTNLGDATPLRGFPLTEEGVRVGDVTLHHAAGGPVVRRGTVASFSLCRVRGRLAVGLRCLRSALGLEAEQALLKSFTDRLLG